MKWKAVSVRDHGFWTDYIAEDTNLVIAQGYDELERKQGRPFGLFNCSDDKRWLTLGFYETVDAAKKAAEISNITPVSPQNPSETSATM